MYRLLFCLTGSYNKQKNAAQTHTECVAHVYVCVTGCVF